MGRPANTVERMMRDHVEKTPACWLWRGTKSKSGYASVSVNYVNQDAHRIFYAHFKGTIPDGYFVRHVCKRKNCVNPAHLEAVTIEESVKRGNNPAGINSRKTHCLRGHPLSGGNLYIGPNNGYRQCRICRAMRLRKSRLNRKTKGA